MNEAALNETADLLHHIPGRLRLRIRGAKGDSARLRGIQDALANLTGVTHAAANVMLGTIIIHYDPVLFAEFPQVLAAYGREHNLFMMPCDDTAPCISEADRSVNRIFGGLNRTVQGVMGNMINLKELLPLALGAYGLFMVDRSAAAAQWLNWIQVAFGTYVDLHEDEPISEVRQKLDLVGASILEQQIAATEALQAEFAALRAEMRGLAERLPKAG